MAYPPLGLVPLLAMLQLHGDIPDAGRLAALDALLIAHNNLYARDTGEARGMRPLSYGIFTGDPAIVGVLLRHGADPDALDTNGVPAWYAAIFADRPDMLAMMMETSPRLNL